MLKFAFSRSSTGLIFALFYWLFIFLFQWIAYSYTLAIFLVGETFTFYSYGSKCTQIERSSENHYYNLKMTEEEPVHKTEIPSSILRKFSQPKIFKSLSLVDCLVLHSDPVYLGNIFVPWKFLFFTKSSLYKTYYFISILDLKYQNKALFFFLLKHIFSNIFSCFLWKANQLVPS